jgi:hypothetical protein
MSKVVPLATQIAAMEIVCAASIANDDVRAALSTLKWVERHQAELRVLGEFPIEKIEVLTPQATGLSAIAPGRDDVTMAVVHAACAVVDADTYKHPVLSRADALATGVSQLHDAVSRWHAAQPACNASATADKASAVSEPVNSQSGVVRRDEE